MIAFEGGSSLHELGPRPDVVCFFHLLGLCSVNLGGSALLTDRLYRRYLRLLELEPARALMDEVRSRFNRTETARVDWSGAGRDAENSRLDLSKSTLAGVFESYFQGFVHCEESARLNYEEFHGYRGYAYEPVRIVIADQPWLLIDKKRPLVEYDALEGSPFWLRAT
jgi:hypothetical protein